VPIAALCLTTSAAAAQTSVSTANRTVTRLAVPDARTVRARRAAAPIVLDGRLDDAAWQSAEVASGFVQQRPTPGAPATERTEARVVFDGTALYVSMRLFDDHPDSLQAPLGRRDSDAYGDWAHVIIDSYHDRRTGFHFAVNPAGTRRDAMISDDAEWQEDESWDAVWDVATSRDSLGWTAEFRIPLTQLRFTSCGDAARVAPMLARGSDTAASVTSRCAWGIQFMRDLARRNERSTWAPIDPGAAGYVSRFGTLAGVDGVRSPRRVDVVPYTLARATRAPLDAGSPFYQRTSVGGALGADVGLGVTSRLTLNATINPDFGQVEADPSEVNLTGAETFLREKRPFFVEGGDIFRYSLGDGLLGEEQLFYSRRVGRAPQLADPDDATAVERPDVTSIFGAAKLSGKAGPWTIGVLDAVTGAEQGRFVSSDGRRGSFIAEPRTNYAFARLSRDGGDGRNSVGVVASAVNRDLDSDAARSLRSRAFAAGIDGRLRSRDRSYTLAANVIGSYVGGTPEAIAETQRSPVHLLQRPDRGGDPLDTTRTSLAGVSAEVRASKQGGGNWRWGINGRAVTSGFEINDVGYQLRSDVISTSGWVGYTHFKPNRILRSWETWFNQWARWTFDGDRERLAANLFAQANFQNNWMLMGEVRREFSQQSPTLLRGGPTTYVPPNVTWWGRLVSDPRRVVSGELITQGYVDDVDGGGRLSFSPMVTLRPSSRAEISLQPNVTRVTNPSQYVETASARADTSYVTGHLAQTTSALTARVNVTFTPALSLQLYAQPFLSAGKYRTLGEVRDAGAHALSERVSNFAPDAISRIDADELHIDRGVGRAPISLGDPSFTVRELNTNAVVRWEYRPGSALFLVWAQSRDDDASAADFSLRREARALWRTPGTNVLLVKVSYWLAPSR
jgi:hypothetical protein